MTCVTKFFEKAAAAVNGVFPGTVHTMGGGKRRTHARKSKKSHHKSKKSRVSKRSRRGGVPPVGPAAGTPGPTGVPPVGPAGTPGPAEKKPPVGPIGIDISHLLTPAQRAAAEEGRSPSFPHVVGGKIRKSKKSHHKSKKSRVSKRSRRGGADEKLPFKLNPIGPSLQKFLDKRNDRKNKANAQKKGGGIISTAMVPFGLLGLQRLLKSRKSNKHHKRSKSAHRTRRR